MSNKFQRNRKRRYCQQAIEHAEALQAEVLYDLLCSDEEFEQRQAARRAEQKRVTEIEERHIEALTYFVVKGQMIGGLALGWFHTRAAALRAAFKAGYTHVTGTGCEAGETTYTRKIRARYCVA